MADMNDIVKLAVDNYHGRVANFSAEQTNETLRQALIDLNGGSTVLDYRKIRDGECKGLFALLETILSNTVAEGLSDNDFFNALVDYRNVALGDQNLFVVEDAQLFFVADAADGTTGIRRQRLGGRSEVTIPTTLKTVKIYEELNRVLSGRIDFNTMINRVSESFRQKMLGDIYSVWSTATADQLGGVTYFPSAGAYDEDELLQLISHVEAAAGGKTATIVGTKAAIRKIKASIQSDGYKDDVYNMGYAGKFFGTPVVAIPQRHKVGTSEFVMNDNMLTIIAGDDKPIKFRAQHYMRCAA